MSLDTAVLTYKNTENIYAEGIETPHGRIKIVFDVPCRVDDEMPILFRSNSIFLLKGIPM